MFLSYNYVMLKCDECGGIHHFQPGQKYDFIGCLSCKEKEDKPKRPAKKRISKVKES